MTFSLRRKHPITRRPIMAVRTAISLALLGGLIGSAAAQTPRPLPTNVAGAATLRTLYYQKTTTPLTQPAIRRTDYQTPDQAEGTIPLPPSVMAVIQRDKSNDRPERTLRNEERISDRPGNCQRVRPDVDLQPIPSELQPEISALNFTGRSFEPRVKYVEPNFVCHRRFYFEEKNAERQGWELGPLQPFVSTGYFLKDFFFLPFHFATRPCDRWECIAGNCLPGDATPYLIYPIEFSVTVALFQAGTVVG